MLTKQEQIAQWALCGMMFSRNKGVDNDRWYLDIIKTQNVDPLQLYQKTLKSS